jgi:hydroxymethylpyrimidine pyrophosphatase-like HAD family hydrolase
MIVVPCKNTVFCDVDDTLVMWNATPDELEARGVDFTCPGALVTIDEDGTEGFAPEWKQRLLPHRKHIEQLKKHKQRGHTVIVWSAGGYDWAAAVVKALGLETYVDLVISKPTWFYDDLTPDEFMGKRYYMKDE